MGGAEHFGVDDVLGLMLDCDTGTLAVKKNGERLGVAATGLTGKFCWAAAVYANAPNRHATILRTDRGDGREQQAIRGWMPGTCWTRWR
jgi:hypothetical protein